jgi:hypothetical protein
MSMWLYQINQQWWGPQRYRVEIWEDERWSWPVGRKIGAEEQPQPGDTVVFFYAPSGGTDAGFYGWAVITEWLADQDTLYFRPVAPSNHLKMYPWWDTEAHELAEKIRGKVKQGTLWRIPDDLSFQVRRGLTRWVGGQAEAPLVARKGPAARPELRA